MDFLNYSYDEIKNIAGCETAKQQLEHLVELFKSAEPFDYDPKMMQHMFLIRNFGFKEGIFDVFKSAINALEKQIPKKPHMVGYGLFCPCCNSLLIDADEIPSRSNNYCGHCGQIIDWDE